MGIGNVVDKLSESAIAFFIKKLTDNYNDKKQQKVWIDCFKKAGDISEGIENRQVTELSIKLSLKRFYYELIENRYQMNIYNNFIISVAMELSIYRENLDIAISLGIAILDNWFECNNIDNCKLKERIDINELQLALSTREKLYCSFFSTYEDSYGADLIRVYYPENEKSWIEWNKKFSVVIKVNLSKGMDLGFCKIGFSYSRIRKDEERFLKIAYLHKNREVFRFEHDGFLHIEEQTILWVK